MNYEKSLHEINHTAEELETITKLYNDNYTGISYKVSQAVKNQVVAEELVAEIFCKASQKIRLYNKDCGQINTWLYTIANNHLLDYFRSNNDKNTVHVNGYTDSEGNESFDFVAPTSTNTDKDVLNSEVETEIKKAFDSLGVRYIDIANFYFLYEYKYSEIATMLNIPEGSVKGMINRIRAKLQESLKVAVKA